MKLKSVRSAKNLTGKTVLLRVAYDVPLKKTKHGYAVEDITRIKETIPTIEYLLSKKCKIVILSWLGRPDGRVVEKYKMDPVARSLSKLLGKKVKKLDDCVGPGVYSEIKKLQAGKLLMLENSRFYHQEEENNKLFSALLLHGIDLIVFDAFAQAHRVHSSTIGIAKIAPTFAGFLLEKEIQQLSRINKKPKKPFVLIVGGAKISDKVGLLTELVKKADKVLVGGGAANVFLKASKVPIGASFVEDAFVDKAKKKKVNPVTVAQQLLSRYREKFVIPVDIIAGSRMAEQSLIEIISLEHQERVRKQWMFLDIGPKTIALFMKEIKKAKTVFVNGPMGVFEIEKFAFGTKKILEAVSRNRQVKIAGGGDTVAAIEKFNLAKKFTHVSTGGGASLEFIAGNELPVLSLIIKK